MRRVSKSSTLYHLPDRTRSGKQVASPRPVTSSAVSVSTIAEKLAAARKVAKPAPAVFIPSRAPEPREELHRKPPSASLESRVPQVIVVDYWDERRLFRYISESIDWMRYFELWYSKKLEFQREGKPRPAHYPDLDNFLTPKKT